MSRGDSSSSEINIDPALDSDLNEDPSLIGQTSRESSAAGDSKSKNQLGDKSKPRGLQKIFSEIGLFDWLLIVSLFLILASIAYLLVGIARYGNVWEQPWLVQ